ncbi:MAG TPA: glycosyltransferase, partial [Ktedonobacteraceae bacterium]
EILLRCPWRTMLEVPYQFQARAHGQSKASMRQGLLVLQHIWRLFREVPAAARIWKVSGLVLLNAVFTLLLFLLYTGFPAVWEPASLVLFAGAAGLNFFLLNRYLFPRTAASDSLPVPAPQVTQADPDQASASLALVSGMVASTTVSPDQQDIQAGAQQQQPRSLNGRTLVRISCVALILAAGLIAYTQPGAWVLLAAICIGAALLVRDQVEQRRAITMLLGIIVGISSVDYLAWRFSVSNWAGWWIAIPLLAAETFGAIHTLGFQYTLWPWTPREPQNTEDPTSHPVFIFIPTVNEGSAILEPTLRGALSARDRYLATYPQGQVTIVVCNDGRVANAHGWQEVEQLTRKLGVECITRTVGGGAKAGNIEQARQQLQATDDALLVIFDADQVAKADFLIKTIPHFADPQVGWVQTGQYYGNLDNPVSRWSDDQQAMFYNLLCPGKAALNASFICGTNVVIRAKALDQIGGLPQDSVTEDFAASIALHPHWRSIYLNDVLATGLGPLDVQSYLKQQRRWAIGTLGVLRTHWREIFLPRKNGLSAGQRIQYFLACTHYLCGLRDLIYLVCPMLFILTGIPAVHGSTLGAFISHFLPYWIASVAGLWYAGRGVTGLRGIIIGFGSFPVLLESLLAVILKRKSGFTVTAKKRRTQRSWSYLLPYLAFMALGVVCLVFAALARGKEQASLFISALWVVYSLVLLSSFLWLNILDERYQAASRRAQREESNSNLHYISRLQLREQGLRPLWNLSCALLLGSVLFVSGSIHIEPPQPTPFVLSQQSTMLPTVGVALPVQLLKTRPGQLEQQLNTHFAIIGRTQDIHDLFDTTWANQLAAEHERPWITLEFGVFGPGGKPPLDASLMAIANGVQDANIERWAQSIRAYGAPILLTVLLQDDRNWALSSAVANGGIPADSARAWQHVRALFKAAGALNVAWVWAPADPMHDQLYAPPTSNIDAVLLSLISYPNTKWANPQQAIAALRQRYPNKPLILEISAAGPAAQKASWLTEVGNAVMDNPDIYALIYHEGSPAISPTVAENGQWSMISDPTSRVAMQQLLAHLRA